MLFTSTSAMRAGLALGAVLMALSGGVPVQAQTNPLGTWTMKTPMPAGVRGEVAAAVYQGKLYAIGGNRRQRGAAQRRIRPGHGSLARARADARWA